MNLNQFAALWIQTSVLAILGALAIRFAGHSSAQVWIGRLVIVALPVLVFVSTRPAPVRPLPVAPRFEVAMPVASSEARLEQIPVRSVPLVESANPGWSPSLLDLYGAGVAVGLVWLGIGYVRLWALTRTAKPLNPEALVAVQSVIDKRIRVRSLPDGSPFVAGVVRPTIYVPEHLQLGSSETMMLLRHELAHVANGDLWWSWVGRLVQIALWPQPLVTLLLKHLAEASERECDRAVLRHGALATDYTRCLVTVSERSQPRLPAPALGAVYRSRVGRRVRWILDRAKVRDLSWTAKLVLAVVSVGLVSLAATTIAGRMPAELQEGKFMEPYSGTVQVTGNLPKEAELQAWLILPNRYQKLKVNGNVVSLPEKIGPGEDYRGTLLVKAEETYAFDQVWPREDALKSITLPKMVTLEGQVLLPDGKPASGIRLSVQVLLINPQPSPVLAFFGPTPFKITATTNAEGRYRFNYLPPNLQVNLKLDTPGFAQLTYNDYQKVGTKITNQAKDLHLAPEAVLTGRVTYNGQPVKGVKVGVQDYQDGFLNTMSMEGSALSDSNGQFRIGSLLTGHVNLIADQLPEGLVARAIEKVRLKQGSTSGGLELKLEKGVRIYGQVRDAKGKPVVRTQVGVYGPAHPRTSAWVQADWTDENGAYSMFVPKGKQHIYLMDGRVRESGRDLDIQKDTKLNFDFIPDPSRLGDYPR